MNVHAHVFSRVWLFATPRTVARQVPLHEGIFPTQGSNPSLLHVSYIAGRFFSAKYLFRLVQLWHGITEYLMSM